MTAYEIAKRKLDESKQQLFSTAKEFMSPRELEELMAYTNLMMERTLMKYKSLSKNQATLPRRECYQIVDKIV